MWVRADEHDPDWYKTHWSSSWDAHLSNLELFLENNPGHASAKAKPTDRPSEGGLLAEGYYGFFFDSPGFRSHGSITGDLMGRVHGAPGLSLLSPALNARWGGRLHQRDQHTFDYETELELHYDQYGKKLRNGFTYDGGAWTDWVWSRSINRDWRGYAAVETLELTLGAEAQRHDASSKVAAERQVFDGGWEQAYVILYGRGVAKESKSPFRFVKDLWIRGIYREGDLVSTGPATPDVVAAAHAAVLDSSMGGTPNPPYLSYRLEHTHSEILEARIRLAEHLWIGASHEIDTNHGFHATTDRLYVEFF